MKKLYIYILSAISTLGISTGCNNFGDVNIDPEKPSDNNMDYSYLFSQVGAQLSGSDWDMWRNGCIYTLNMMQQSSSATWSMGVFYTYSEGYNAAAWDNYYQGRGPIRNLVDIMYHWKGNVDHQYEYQYARIMKAYLFQRMTDLYGDVPYFEAGEGYLALNGQPKYDSQEAIYDDLLKELDEVNAALKALPIQTSEKDPISTDVLFKGDSERWRKFGNSLMLRVAMRLSKVNPTKASEYVGKAVANGLIQNASEDAILNRSGANVSDDSANPFGKILSESDSQGFYMSESFVNTLKENNDPRLHLLATKVETPATTWSNKYDYGNSDSLNLIIGFPTGFRSSGDFDILYWANLPKKYKDDKELDWRPYFALVNRYTFANPETPSMLITYPEDCLLLADAAVRGFIPGGTATAKEYFIKGVTAAMQQYSYYSAANNLYNKYLSDSNIANYINQRSTAFSANPLREINWEYYVLTFGDPYETFANWRRSGYPELTSVYSMNIPLDKDYTRPATYPNSVTNEIPRRFTYPIAETSVNNANYQDAVSKLSGGDKISSRVWWDAK